MNNYYDIIMNGMTYDYDMEMNCRYEMNHMIYYLRNDNEWFNYDTS